MVIVLVVFDGEVGIISIYKINVCLYVIYYVIWVEFCEGVIGINQVNGFIIIVEKVSVIYIQVGCRVVQVNVNIGIW